MLRNLAKRRISDEEIIKEKGLTLDYDEMARRGGMTPEEKAISKWYGIYASRVPGHHMARVVVPGGRITSVEARDLAHLAKRYSPDVLSITTRQAIQFHALQLQDLGPFLRDVRKIGMTTFHGCGDVTRNVAACPRASICQHRLIDVLPMAQEISDTLASYRDLDNLPRKYKITLSGCGAECAQPHINCNGVVAVRRRRPDGTEETGFRILIGGGMGWRPFQGQELYSFVPLEKVNAVCRAVALLFRDHGDRYARMFARLKFIVHRYGIEKCREIVNANLEAEGVDRAGIEHEPIDLISPDVPLRPLREADPVDDDGLAIQGIKVPKGEISADHFAKIADLSEMYGDKFVYTTNRQNIEIHGVKPDRLPALREAIAEMGLETSEFFGLSDVVSCVGKTYCPLAVTHTHDLYDGLSALVREDRFAEIRDKAIINITGCPNSCSPYRIADIGFRGMRIRGLQGSEEGYQLTLGGRESKFGDILGEFKCDDCIRIVSVVLEKFRDLRQGEETLSQHIDRIGMEPYETAVETLGIDYEKAVNPNELSVDTGRGETPLDIKTIERDVPCRTECPANTNVPEYIRLIAAGEPEAAHRVNQEDNVLPGVLGRICTRPCQDRCRHEWTNTSGPVQICHLKRAAADQKDGPAQPLPAWYEATGKRIAIIGGGPAGLAAARELKRYGHEVVLFDRESGLGGQIQIGIPEFRLPRKVLQEDVDAIVNSGIDVKLGESFNAERLLATVQEFDATVLAVGANRPRSLELEGLPEGVAVEGLNFMKHFNEGRPIEVGSDVVVIGGGFTAVDCARSARRLAAKGSRISIMYRRGEAQMAATPDELIEMRAEDIHIDTLVTPLSVRMEDGRIQGVVFRRNILGEGLDNGKPNIIPVEGSEYEVPCDTLIFAIGQTPDRSVLPEGTTVTSAHETSIDGLFVAGDFSSPKAADVINAVADGKQASHVIDSFLMGEERRRSYLKIEESKPTGRLRDHDLIQPPHMSVLPMIERDHVSEVELGLTEEAADSHAWRCYLCNHKFEIDQDKCIHCDWCIRVSPRPCILRLGELERDEDGAPIQWTEVPADQPENATYIWIDSDQCIRCGACVNICPVEAISVRKNDVTCENCG